MTNLILDPLTPWIIIAIGILFITFEIFITSFILIWFGIGFILTGILSYIIDFYNSLWQFALASFIGIISMLILRNKLMSKFLKPKDNMPKDNFFDEKGIGIIYNNQVKYKATYWKIKKIKPFDIKDNMEVTVLNIKKGIATIQPIEKEDI